MSRNRLNPWPSIADLFSALVVATFAALLLTNQDIASDAVRTRAEQAAHEMVKKLSGELESTKAGVKSEQCRYGGPDTCIEIDFRFALSNNELSGEGEAEIQKACKLYRSQLDNLVRESGLSGIRKDEIVLVIEGHSDSQSPKSILSAKERNLYNWALSSRRAAEVLYSFQRCGVSAANGYNISASGFADTRPLCVDKTEACFKTNRRTTMRIRADLGAIQKRLESGSQIKSN